MHDFANINGIKLHYLDWGGLDPCLLLLAGFSNSALIFKSFGDHFTERFRVVALSRRSHGQSEITVGGLDLDSRVEDIRAFLDHLEVGQAILVGHSMAGDEMTRFTQRYPARVRALVYLDAAMQRNVQLQGEDPLKHLYTQVEPEESWHSINEYFAYVRRAHPIVTQSWDVWRDELLASVDLFPDGRVVNRFSPDVVGKYTQEMGKFHPDYSSIHCPAISFYAIADVHPRLPQDANHELAEAANAYYRGAVAEWKRENAARFQEQVRGSEVVEIHGVSHYLFLDKEVEVADRINQFLAGV